jgi:hypothetical protein
VTEDILLGSEPPKGRCSRRTKSDMKGLQKQHEVLQRRFADKETDWKAVSMLLARGNQRCSVSSSLARIG